MTLAVWLRSEMVVQISKLSIQREYQVATPQDRPVRSATLRLVAGADMPVLKASMPPDSSRADFAKVGGHAFDLISKLTGHPCLSGRFRFEFEDLFVNRAMVVDLQGDKLITG
jgi:hypothetical protein